MKIKEEVGEMPSIHMDESADPGWRIMKLHAANVSEISLLNPQISVSLSRMTKKWFASDRDMRVGKWFDSRD